MAFCFDTRGEAAKRIAERGGANYRHNFIEASTEGMFTLYHTTDPVPGYQFETVPTLDEAFDVLENLALPQNPVVERDKPLAWRFTNRSHFEADDGIGLYVAYPQRRRRLFFGPRIIDYTATYSTLLHELREMEKQGGAGNALQFVRMQGRLPKPDVAPCRFKTLDLAKAVCERHHATGKWD